MAPSPRRLAAALTGLALAACGHDGSPPPSTLYTLAPVSATSSARTSTVVSQPLAVTVHDPSGAAAIGVPVRYRLTSGASSTTSTLRDSIAATDVDGVARGELLVGTGGPVAVLAYVKGQEDRGVTLTIDVTAAPQITSVPATLLTGDTVTLGGTGFASLGPDVGAFFGPTRAAVVAVLGDAAIRVVVPPCAQPGAGLRLASSSGATGSVAVNVVVRPTTTLRVGEAAMVPQGSSASCVALPADGARYLVVPQLAGTGTRVKQPFTLGTARSSAGIQSSTAALSSTAGPRERFEGYLRARERELAPTAAQTARTIANGVALEALTVGSTRTFKVIDNLCLQKNGGCTLGFGSATATLRYLGQHVALYVDNAPTAGATFTDAELQSFGALFDGTLYQIDARTFGSESDIDRNGHVIVLLTPTVNGLTASSDCSSGFVAGFFFSDDLASTASYSNRGEVFYTLAPDATGAKSCAHSADAVKSLAPATFIHEFQHMISFNQHAIVRGGAAEDTWLNEGLSHVAEELGSRYYEGLLAGLTPSPEGQRRSNAGQLFPDSASGFVTPDLRNAYAYLADPTNNSVTTYQDFGTLEDRGASWLFLRWLADQKGDAILGRLVQTSRTGVDNVADKAGESFAQLFNDFAIATYADSLPGVPRAQIPSRYHFAPNRNLRTLFNRLSQTGVVASPFPIQPAGLPTTSSALGAMMPGTMSFYTLTTPTSGPAFTLLFTPGDATTFAPALGAQVGVLRIP